MPAHREPLGQRHRGVEQRSRDARDDDRRPGVLEREDARVAPDHDAERVLQSRRSSRPRWRRSSRVRSRPSRPRRCTAARSGSARGGRSRPRRPRSDRISSIDAGRTDVSPRSVFTSTGKKQMIAAIAIFERGREQAEPVVRDRREGDDRDRVRRDRVRHDRTRRAAASARAREPTGSPRPSRSRSRRAPP